MSNATALGHSQKVSDSVMETQNSMLLKYFRCTERLDFDFCQFCVPGWPALGDTTDKSIGQHSWILCPFCNGPLSPLDPSLNFDSGLHVTTCQCSNVNTHEWHLKVLKQDCNVHGQQHHGCYNQRHQGCYNPSQIKRALRLGKSSAWNL